MFYLSINQSLITSWTITVKDFHQITKVHEDMVRGEVTVEHKSPNLNQRLGADQMKGTRRIYVDVLTQALHGCGRPMMVIERVLLLGAP